MGYGFIFFFPALVLGSLFGLSVVVHLFRSSSKHGFWWLLAASAPLVVANMGAFMGLRDTAFAAVADRPAGRLGWDLSVAEGFGVWYASDAAGNYLPWTIVPLVFGIVLVVAVAVKHRNVRFRRVVAAAMLLASIVAPARLAAIWYKPHAEGTWPVEDRRWQVGYVAEWLDAGLPSSAKGCFNYLSLRFDEQSNEDANGTKLLRQRLGPRLKELDQACRSLCEQQSSENRWNPGVLEEPCLLLLSRAQ